MIFSGLDLGKAKDNLAFVTVDRLPNPTPSPKRKWRYEVKWLRVWDLGTKYTEMAADVAGMYGKRELSATWLAPDFTGVGRPVVETLQAARVKAKLMPINTTSGKLPNFVEAGGGDPRHWNVPKRDLVTTLQVMLQGGLVKWSPRLPLVGRLEKELSDFKVTITKARNETFGADSSQHDDLCLPGEVPVLTERGCVPIADVTTDDRVMTREGWKQVLWSGMTSESASTITIEFTHACVLQCTPSHPVFTVGRGWVAASELRRDDEVLTCPLLWRLASGMGECGEGTQSQADGTTACTTNSTQSGKGRRCFFTERFGKQRTVKSQRGMRSTTLTKTPPTMTLKTLSASRLRSIGVGTWSHTGQRHGLSTFAGFGRDHSQDLPRGGRHRKGKQHSRNKGDGYTKADRLLICPAVIAENHSSPKWRGQPTAQSSAPERPHRGSRFTSASASIVKSRSSQRRPAGLFVPARVLAIRENKRSVPVFNLTVADCPEFFASGVLVHNCFALMLAIWLGEHEGGGDVGGIGGPRDDEVCAGARAPAGVYPTDHVGGDGCDPRQFQYRGGRD